MSEHLLPAPTTGADIDSVPQRPDHPDAEFADLRPSGQALFVYACHPMTSYGTPWAANHVARLVELYRAQRLSTPSAAGSASSAESARALAGTSSPSCRA